MYSVELDDEFLELFYNITNTKIPKTVDLLALKTQLVNIVETMQELNNNARKPISNKVFGNNEEDENNNPNSILIVDDLGVITYQLKVMLSQFGYDVDCSQEIYDAVNKYKKRKYKYVVMDLFIPTEREGFILLSELKKLSNMFNANSTIGVITASPRKEIEIQCKERGADFFLEKNSDWQNQLYNIMDSYINVGDDDDF